MEKFGVNTNYNYFGIYVKEDEDEDEEVFGNSGKRESSSLIGAYGIDPIYVDKDIQEEDYDQDQELDQIEGGGGIGGRCYVDNLSQLEFIIYGYNYYYYNV
ncbi:MAG: hypothetical protein EZS28_030634 [Streblomastix strix]|uniref:Uncharacterized protein n=1 Tax=Streblomastix strix TaxID=222440 RepID=A0A5J4UTV4_9EUKA|nr:MAG: hypothetical protein EZS28_030634 [Streblomastix strix]